MSIEFVKIDARKVLPYYFPLLLLIVGFVLFWKTPLATGDLILNPILNSIACLKGMVIAWALFNDSGGTAAYIFSRPLSRKRLFLTRWGLGISFQLLTILIVLVTIATGLRSGIQLLMDSPYQPMVRWYELYILGSIALFSMLGYQVVMFLRLRASVLTVRPPTWRDNLATALAIVVCLPFLPEVFTNNEPIQYRLTYSALVMILGTLGALHCYQCLEIKT